MGINADLHAVEIKLAQRGRFGFTNQDGVGLELDVEAKVAGAAEDREAILAQERLAAADRQLKNPRLSHLAEQAIDLYKTHLARIVVIEVTVHAALVASVSDIEMRDERHARADRPLVDLRGQRTHGVSPVSGASPTSRMPRWPSALINSSASRYAVSASISKCGTIRSSTIARSGV